MPSVKRSHSSLPEEQDDGSDEQAESTQSSPHSSKRPRQSESPMPDSDTEGSDEDGIGRKLRSWEVEDEDELELRATQAIQEKYSFASDEPNVPADHGILERVECYNFMCHDRFYVELGPLINFIVGKNGSGKSAILTAITLCLGGKASATNRGQSLKSFVKEGKENACIIVQIKNQGDGAYMPDDYGRSIIVERHFSKSGTSGFKIKADNGRIVSTKKIDLDYITEFFNLQIDNPMNVLSQDMARQFLSSSSPAEKYKFFIRGVQLEQLDQDYRLIEENIDQVTEKLEGKKEDIERMKEASERAKHKLHISDQHENLRKRLRHVRNQMAWAQVEEQEKTRDELGREVARIEERIKAEEAGISRFDPLFQEAENESERAAEIVHQATANCQRAENERGEIKDRSDEDMRERHGYTTEQRQIRDHLKATEARINDTQQKIAAETQRLAEISGGSYTRKREELQQAKDKASAARQRYEEHQASFAPLQKELQEADAAAKSAYMPVSKKRAEIEQAETHLRNLSKEGAARQLGFPERMPALLRAIQQHKGSFKKPPVGPVGQHVSLLKPEWSSILENSLGNTLNSFVVTAKSDMNILSNLMQRVNCQCPIIIGKEGSTNDSASFEPDPRFVTALRVLQIDNELVRRQLIFNHGIEQVLLIERLEEATPVLYDGPRPRNVKRCFCIDQANRRRGFHLSYSRSGEPTQAPVGPYNGSPRMKSDLASQVGIQREIVTDLKRELNSLEEHLRSCRSRAEGCRQALVRHHRQDGDLHVNMQRMEEYAEQLGDALEQDNVGDGRLQGLQEVLREAEDDRGLFHGQFEDSCKAIDAVTNKLKRTRQELSAKDEEIASLSENLRVAQSEELKVSDNRRRILANKNAAIKQIDELKNGKAKLERKQQHYAERVVEYSKQASQVSPRVAIDEGETASSLDKKLDRFDKDLRRYHDQIGASRDEIARDAKTKNASYMRAQTQYSEIEMLSRIFTRTLHVRRNRWEMLKAHISSRAKGQFTYLLSERSFRGRLLTDHKSKLLDLLVEPDITKDSDAGRGARTLSGGEKSFSQVCLLLALWEAMGSPIRCLDEFDVYMDLVNRKMAIDMLMVAARRSAGRQFILITPGSRAEISLAPDVKVKELAEPERGQATLSFSR